VFVLAAVHLKSKGCGKDEDAARGADADQRDGQGCWTPVRVDSVQRLQQWLAGDPTQAGANAPALIVGDFNAYAMEDPMRAIRAAGWQDAFALKPSGERPYSYVFDGQAGRLDHALVNAAMAARLRGAVEWHANADESDALNYEMQRDGDPYRASDHDPLMVGLDLRK
jgi:predicted extracellular nuclease